MNQTYLVKDGTCTNAELQFKIRINNLKKRTKVLLRNHNWQKFFTNSPSKEQQQTIHQSASSPDVCRHDMRSSILSPSYDQNEQTMDYDSMFAF
jgi:hypothetical protein